MYLQSVDVFTHADTDADWSIYFLHYWYDLSNIVTYFTYSEDNALFANYMKLIIFQDHTSQPFG